MTWEEAVLWLRSQPEQAELVRDCFYDDPLLGAADRYHTSTEWRAIRPLLPATPGRALDVGAGRGIAAYALARDGWSVVALEPDPSPIVGCGAIRALAREAGVSIEVCGQPGERIPFPDGTFDLVFGRAVMHHAADLGRFTAEVARVLRPDGVFVAAREHVITARDDLGAFLDAHPLHRFYGGENAFTLGAYRSALREAGLRLTRCLNPWASDVNLFPDTRAALHRRFAARHGLAEWMVPGWVHTALGATLKTPGRLYTFVCRRRSGR